MPKRELIGVVKSASMSKTRRVEIARRVKHPMYGKYVQSRTVCYVHDEHDEAQVGDTVAIIESKPLSKLKRWRLTKVVRKAAVVSRD